MDFTPYEKMGSSQSEWRLDERGHRALKGLRWVVTEKIHGAHFALLTDGAQVRPAKRKQLLSAHDAFFNYQVIIDRLAEPARALFRALQEKRPEVEAAVIHGELFGGLYPHPSVDPDPNVQAIQTGVFYCPSVEFCAFDIACIHAEERSYLDYDEALALFSDHGFFAAEPLSEGGWAEVGQFKLPFVSTVPARLGLPPLDSNWAEGVVIKPVKSVWVHSGGKRVRPILKRKIDRFAEDQRYHQARAWAAPAVELDPLSQLEEALRVRVNKNRLDAALSKIGRVTLADENGLAELRKELMEDVRAELGDVLPRALAQLDRQEQQLLWSVLEDEIEALLQTLPRR